MALLNPYLNFQGNTEEVFNFYKSVFGGEFQNVTRFKDTHEAAKMSAEDGEKLMHIALPIGKDNVLMGTDMLESFGQKMQPGNNFSLSYHTDSREEADKIFAGISEGGKVVMPLADTFWGSYFGMATDKFGTQWTVSYDGPAQQN